MRYFLSHITIPFLGFLLLLAGCKADDWDTPVPTSDNAVHFVCHTSDYIEVKTRATVGTNEVHLFTFDENGSLIEVVHARPSGTQGRYQAVLDAANRVRVIHFLALPEGDNSPIQTIINNPDNYKGKDEREVMNRFSTTSGAYWRRKTYSALPANGDIGPVSLLRNQAAIKVTKGQSVELPPGYNFEILGWAFYGQVNKGTYASYNSENDRFPTTNEEIENRLITIPPDMQYIYPNAADLVFSTDSLVFERRQNLDDHPFFVILKAEYGPIGSEQVCYYKLQLSDNEELERLDIVRNYLYNMQVVEVAKPGEPTVQDALDKPVANDATISLLLSFYNKITDGHETLEVERTAYMFAYPSRSFSMNFTYTNKEHTGVAPVPRMSLGPNIEKAFAAGSLQISNVNTDEWASAGKITGTIIGTTTENIPALGDINTKFTLKVGKLAREVRIRVVKPLDYAAPEPTFTPDNPSQTGVNGVYTLKFKLPADMDPALFPMKFYIDTKTFTPTDAMIAQGLYIEKMGNDYRYVYTAHAPGEEVTLKFRRNLSDPGVVTLLSRNFSSERFPIFNDAVYEDITGVIVVGSLSGETPVPQGADVKMQPLNIPDYGFKVTGEGRFSMIVRKSIANTQTFTFKYTLPEGLELTKTYSLGDLRTNKKIVFDGYSYSTPVTGQLVTFETGNGNAAGERPAIGPNLVVSSTVPVGQYKFERPTPGMYSISFREDCPNDAVFTFRYRHPQEGILITAATKTVAELKAGGVKITFPFWWVSGRYQNQFWGAIYNIGSYESYTTPELDPDKYKFTGPSSPGRYSFAVSGNVPLSENPTFTIRWQDWAGWWFYGTFSKSQLLNNNAGGIDILLTQ